MMPMPIPSLMEDRGALFFMQVAEDVQHEKSQVATTPWAPLALMSARDPTCEGH
jgi:hypothetical protein